MVDAPSVDAVSHESELIALRAELKEWERAFAAKNGGRKAGRDDIKSDGEIAAKYKAYSRLREEASSSSTATAGAREVKDGASPRTKKRKIQVGKDKDAFETPQKRTKHFATTSFSRSEEETQQQQQRREQKQLHPSQLDPYDSPSHARALRTPSSHNLNRQSSESPLPLRTAIGPTPQRDGKALGLFDLLSASGKSSATPGSAAATPSQRKRRMIDVERPSKSRRMAPGNRGNDKEQSDGPDDKDVPFTPSAQRSGGGIVRTRRYSLTPASSAKKFYLSRFFATPTVSRFSTIPEEGRDDLPENKGGETPNKSKNGLETPSFLRRRSLFSGRGAQRNRPAANGIQSGVRAGDAELSPAAVRKPPRVVGKGLSALVQGLRDMEDQRMDDDMDVLREMEEAQERNKDNDDSVLVGDSQIETARGRNGEETEEAGSSLSKHRASPKKRGQKRTTRLVTMRPNTAPPKPQPQWEDIPEEDDEPAAPTTTTPVSPNKYRGSKPTADVRQGPSDAAEDELAGQDSEADDSFNDDSRENDNGDDNDFVPDESIADALAKSRKRGLDAVKKRLEKTKKSRRTADEPPGAEAKKKTKNVNAEAHANYRALKIRSRGSGGSAKGRFRGKFRRK